MSLQSLVFCADDKILRVLRRVLGDLEIRVDHCSSVEAALNKLTRQRYEAVIVDCSDEHAASQVLRSARTAPCNKRAVAVAIIDGQTAVRSAFELGAHFVLYKPISSERAKSSFRAARALMKRERRRNARIAVEIPVILVLGEDLKHKALTSDLGEGGMALHQFRSPRRMRQIQVQFTLPESDFAIDCTGEVAWENSGRQTGIRFVDLTSEVRGQLKDWLGRHSPDMEKDDPPVPCKLTDLSPGACYLEMSSPFPARTRVILKMGIADVQAQVEGVVRMMHPEIGMGIEFTRNTSEQRELLEKFIRTLTNSKGVVPELAVEPEGLDTGEPAPPSDTGPEDPLLNLFHHKSDLTPDDFQAELRKQRRPTARKATATFSV